MKNLAIQYKSEWEISLANVEKTSSIKPGEVLINVKATGICGTDIGIIAGKYKAKKNVLLGHESSGLVLEVGSEVTMFQPGDRVFIDPTYYCGTCKMCRTGRQNHCEMKHFTETGVSRDGTFSPYYITEERFLYKIESDISFGAAALAEPLSCTLTGVNQLRNVRPEFATVVFGGGTMGVLYSHALNLKGLKGSVIEISKDRLVHVKNALPEGWKAYSSIEECIMTNGISPIDIAVDASGVMMDKTLNMLQRGGQLIMVGLRDCLMSVNPMHIADRSLSIIGSIDSLGTFGTAVHLLSSRKIDGEKLITGIYPIEKFEDAMLSLGLDIENKRVLPAATGLKVMIEP